MRPRMRIGSEEWLCLLGLLRCKDNWSIEDGKLVHSTSIAVLASGEDQIECHFGGDFLAWVPDDEDTIAIAIAEVVRHLQKSRFDGFLVSAKMCLDDIPSEEENTSYGRERAHRIATAQLFAKMNSSKANATVGSGGGGGGSSGPIPLPPLNITSPSTAASSTAASSILNRIRQKTLAESEEEVKAVTKAQVDAMVAEQTPKAKKPSPWYRW